MFFLRLYRSLPWISRHTPDLFLLRHLLKRVSRSFYLSLRVLPAAMRTPISLAYLFCRAADTIADTPLIPPTQRQHALQRLRRLLLTPSGAPAIPPDLYAPPSALTDNAEHALLQHVTHCVALLAHLPSYEQRLVSQLVCTLTHGMAMDLTYFAPEKVATLRALPDRATLDLYTYYVAGVVGQFWTKIHAQTFKKIARQPHRWYDVCALAIHFGQGLQMTNILKDIGKDSANGRCYLPEEHLLRLDVTPRALTTPASLPMLRPLLYQYCWDTLGHLDQAYHYIVTVPYTALRLRVSCMWPLLFAIQTLETICRTDTLLDPTARVKITRPAVYRTIVLSTACLLMPGLFLRYYAALRQRFTHMLRTLSRVSSPPNTEPL